MRLFCVFRRLQILSPDNRWLHVPYIPNTIVVNVSTQFHYLKACSRRSIPAQTADILSFATGGYLKSTIHRVVRPPEDQAHVQRMGLFYFSRAAHDWKTGVVAPSPVLESLGLYKATEQPAEPVSGLGAYPFLQELCFGISLRRPAGSQNSPELGSSTVGTGQFTETRSSTRGFNSRAWRSGRTMTVKLSLSPKCEYICLQRWGHEEAEAREEARLILARSRFRHST